jgi:hypothetical protein
MPIQIGDTCEVTNGGACYDTHETAARAMNATNWTSGNSLSVNMIVHVINIMDNIALVERDNAQYLIGVTGLKVIHNRAVYSTTSVTSMPFKLGDKVRIRADSQYYDSQQLPSDAANDTDGKITEVFNHEEEFMVIFDNGYTNTYTIKDLELVPLFGKDITGGVKMVDHKLIKLGARVRCLKYESGEPSNMSCTKNVVGMTGTVVGFESSKPEVYKVSFDDNITGYTDKSLGIKAGHGQSVHASCLEVIDSKGKKGSVSFFVVGETPVSSQVKKLSETIYSKADAMEYLKECLRNSSWGNELTLFELKPVAEARLKPVFKSIKKLEVKKKS